MGFYFNRIYNPVYDFIVGQIAPYHRLQETCISKLELNDGDRLICAGIGTGNEALRILDHTHQVQITGIDSSDTALRKAQKKARTQGIDIETKLMDVHRLDFPDETFDNTLCVHVTDFLADSGKAASELLRVLKKGGHFAITFPSSKEDLAFGISIIGDTIHSHIKARKYWKMLILFAAATLGAIVYLPFLFRRERRQYAKTEIEGIFATQKIQQLQIEEFPVYSDFIAYGIK